MSIWSLEKLHKARWIGIGNAVLPPLLIFTLGSALRPGSDNAVEVKGRPPGWFFTMIWTVIALLWTERVFTFAAIYNMRKKNAVETGIKKKNVFCSVRR